MLHVVGPAATARAVVVLLSVFFASSLYETAAAFLTSLLTLPLLPSEMVAFSPLFPPLFSLRQYWRLQLRREEEEKESEKKASLTRSKSPSF